MRPASVSYRTAAILAVAASSLLSCPTALASRGGDGSAPAGAAVARLVTHVPTATLNAVGAGSAARGAYSLSGDVTSTGSTPQLLTVNMTWCPHCAANSWALAVALSRFGTLSGLRTLDTGTVFADKYHARPGYSHARGLSFFTARLRSRYVRLRSRVLQDVAARPLQTLSAAETSAVEVFDRELSVPAIDVGGVYGFRGSAYSPQLLIGVSWLHVARALADASSPLARAVDGQANLLSAAICAATHDRPRSVCRQPGVLAATPQARSPYPEGTPVPS